MGKFTEKIQYEKIYDTGLLYQELEDLKEIEKAGNKLIEEYILNQKIDTNKIEFGVIDQCFYIQVIVKTIKMNRYKPIEMNRFKFIYPIVENSIMLSEQQSINKKIFHFYLTKTIGFLRDMNIRYS
jgi:hypothetical protein